VPAEHLVVSTTCMCKLKVSRSAPGPNMMRRRTVQDLAQLFDSQKPSALDIPALVLVASEPAPEQQTFYL
jgi:hypothetical protein